MSVILSTETILQRLITGQSLSLIRIGDGESIVLNSQSNIAALQLCIDAVMKRQMGYEPPLGHIQAIRGNLIEAYSKADIIGIPMHTQATNRHWQAVRGVLEENIPHHTEDMCSIDIHYDLLNCGGYTKLVSQRPKLFYIGCRNLEERMKEYWCLERVSGYHIAPEAKFTSGYDGDVHYPTQFNKVQRWMNVMEPQGQLLFVGAGVIGKIYCNWWRDRGGVAIDIGSVMDEFYGAVTRGKDRAPDKIEDSKYKL